MGLFIKILHFLGFCGMFLGTIGAFGFAYLAIKDLKELINNLKD